MHRLSSFLLVLCACLTLAGCPKAEPTGQWPNGVIGYYRLDLPESTPVGNVMHLGIEKDRWLMRDMMIGYGGTWTMQDGKAVLTVTEGPTGKANGSEKLSVEITEKGLDLSHPKNPSLKQVFIHVQSQAPDGFGYDEFLGARK